MSLSTLTRLAPTQVELEIPISIAELAAAEDRAFRKLAKNVRLPGFRAGKVPRKVFEQNYGSTAITNQAVEEVLPEVYAKAVREHDLEPVDRPKMEVLEEVDGRPARVKATVEVRPAIALGEYKGVVATRPAVVVTDADVERSLEALAKERATLVPVDRAAQLGDVVTLDYEGKIDGTAFEGGSASGQVTELSEGRFIPGFVAGIAGMTAGETKDIEAQFPDLYGQAELAGKTAVFAVTLHEIKQFDLPAIDDEFAKTVSDNATVADLRGDIRRRLLAISASRERRAIGNAVMEKLLKAHDFPLPATMVDAQVEQLMNDVASEATRAGTTFDEYLTTLGKTEDTLRIEYRADAEMQVKGTLLIEQIAKTEHIAATPADVAEELEALARQYRQPVAKVRQALGNGVLSLMDGIVRSKTLEFLIDNAEVTTGGAGAPGEETPEAPS
ncbi:MAG: trigger factor [Candidatus Tumulicola sp.]